MKLLECSSTSELTKRIIKSEPERTCNVILQNSDEILNIRPGAKVNTREVLDLLMETDTNSFVSMVTKLCNSRNENIMHCMAKENMIIFTKHLIEKIQKYNAPTAFSLMFSRNVDGNSPIMAMIQKNSGSVEEKNLILSIWNTCLDSESLKELSPNEQQQFQDTILSSNEQQETILDLCIQFKMHDLFIAISRSDCFDPEKIFYIFNDPSSTPLKKIFDEAFLKTVLLKYSSSQYSWGDFSRETQKIVLWHACKKDFNEVFQFIKESMPQHEFLEIIMIQDDDSNNSSMIAAKEASEMVLNSLLSTLAYSTDCDMKNEYIHLKNKSGDTLLKLIISHGETLSMHREVMIKAEREYHRIHDNLNGLTQCFKINIGPHFAIDKALRNEEKYFKQPTTWQKMKLWFIIFLVSVFPFALYLVDVGTDIFLVVEYDLKRNVSPTIQGCERLNDYLGNQCSVNNTVLKNLADIPSELSTEACFNYSLAFIIFPIISFFVEWHSYKKEELKTVGI